MSKQELFLYDIQKFYDKLTSLQEEQNRYFELAKGKNVIEAKMLVDSFLEEVGIKPSKEATVASLNYLINLREDSLEQLFKQQGFTQEQIDAKLEIAYSFNSKRYLNRFEELITYIEENNLFTPFYRAIISGVHSIGENFTRWQSRWRAHIINGVNRELFELFNGDEDKVFQMLQKENLLDCKNGKIADRCYSVLVNDNGKYKRVSYADAFSSEVDEIIVKIDILVDILEKLEDNVYNQKSEWINYFLAIKEAFLHTNPDNLVSLWADVDRAWMKITTPLQIGHPLEYYEDHFRKAVALEWDLRIVNPKL